MSGSHRLHERCGCAARAASPRAFSLPSTTRKFERDRPFNLTHLSLDIALDINKKSLSATAIVHTTKVDHLASVLKLDAVGFEIKSVQISNDGDEFGTTRYRYDGEVIHIDVPHEKAQIKIIYSVTPKRGLYFLSPDEHVLDRPTQVWSQCQDEDARYWFPCHDKPHQKCTTEMRVTVPRNWYALSNGTLVDSKKTDDSATYHWRMNRPHSCYLVTLAAGEFAKLDAGEVKGVPVDYLVPRGREQDGWRTFSETPAMIEHFSKLTGVDYPWEKYSQVVVADFVFGGMENTTATTMYEYILLDERAALDVSSHPLIAHELAHQWFGDLVTCRDWSHGWLNEGFATFFEGIDRERRLGRDEYEYGLLGDQDTYLSEAAGRYKRPIVCQDYEDPIDLFDAHLYEKGGLVLHLLRTELGDEVFWKGVRNYLQANAYSIVETRDLLRAMENVSGRSLERFFEQWVYKAGHPELDVRIEIENERVVVHVTQSQRTGADVPLFALNLELDLCIEGVIRREVVSVERAKETFAFRTSTRVDFVVVDPRHRVLGEVRIDAPVDSLRSQLKNAHTARGRWIAAQSLSRRDDPATLNELFSTLSDPTAFWGVRVEAAHAIGSIRTDESLSKLKSALAIEHPKVRRAVISAVGKFRKRDAAEALRPYALKDPSYLVEAEAARSLGATRQSAAFDTLIEILDRPSWGDAIRSGAADGLAALRDDRAVPHLLARTRYGVPTRARRAAIRSVAKLSTDRRTREVLEDLLEDRDPHTRSEVASALGEIGDSKSRSALNRALDNELDGRVRRRIRDVIRDLVGTSSTKGELQRLNDELESLRNELTELRSRLSKVDAK